MSVTNLLAESLSRGFNSSNFYVCHTNRGEIKLTLDENNEHKNHCVDTLNKIMFLMHGVDDALMIFSQLRPTNFCYQSIITTDQSFEFCEEIGAIQIKTLLRDYVIDQALIKEENQKKRWNELIPVINSLALTLGSRFQDVSRPYLAICQDEWTKGNRKAIKNMEIPAIEFSKEIRLEQLQMWKSVLSQNRDKLSSSVGFMYYALIRTHKENSCATTCHAFALQQEQVDNCDMYSIWQSWNNSYPVFNTNEERALDHDHKLFPEESLNDFLGDLKEIFSSESWNGKPNSLWKKWFGEIFFNNQHKSMSTVKLDECNNTLPTLNLKGLSLAFSFTSYNPSTINQDIDVNSMEIQDIVDENIELEF
jgi:hypothetical protein